MTIATVGYIGYSNGEVETIKKNLEKIGQYCATHFIPKLVSGDLWVYIEDEQENDPNRHALFLSGKGEVSYTPKATRYTFDSKKPDNIYSHWRDAMPLIEHWPEVKKNIENAIQEMDGAKQAMLNFQV